LLAMRSTGRVHEIVGIVFSSRGMKALSSTPPFSLSPRSADVCTSCAIHAQMQMFGCTHMHRHMHVAYAARTLADDVELLSRFDKRRREVYTSQGFNTYAYLEHIS